MPLFSLFSKSDRKQSKINPKQTDTILKPVPAKDTEEAKQYGAAKTRKKTKAPASPTLVVSASQATKDEGQPMLTSKSVKKKSLAYSSAFPSPTVGQTSLKDKTKPGIVSNKSDIGSKVSSWLSALEKRNSKRASVSKKFLTVDNDKAEKSSVEKLLVYTPEGIPYINMHNLIWAPKHTGLNFYQAKMGRWLLMDYLGIACTLLSWVCIFYYLCLGIFVSFGLRPTIGSILNDEPSFDLVNTSPTSSFMLGICLVIDSCILVVARCTGFFAIISAEKKYYVRCIVIDVLTLMLEFWIGGSILFSATCPSEDFLEKPLLQIMDKYTLIEGQGSTPLTVFFNDLQTGLGCCGVHNWTDYFSNEFRKKPRYQVDGTQLNLPHACCKGIWRRDINCAHLAHLWIQIGSSNTKYETMFRNRIQQIGCLEALNNMCEQVISFMGEGVFAVAIFRLLFTAGFCTCAHFTWHTLNVVVSESRKEKVIITEAYKAARVEAEKRDSEEDFDLDDNEEVGEDGKAEPEGLPKSLRRRSLLKFWQTRVKDNKAPPPTEDQVKNVKKRTFYTAMAAALSQTSIGVKMERVRDKVAPANAEHDSGTEIWDKMARQLIRDERKAKAKKLQAMISRGSLSPTSSDSNMKRHKKKRHRYRYQQKTPWISYW